MPTNEKKFPILPVSRSPRLAATLDLARESPAFAQACAQRLTGQARDELVGAMIAGKGPLRPIKKAVPRTVPTELSLQLQSYAKLVRR